VYIDAQEGAFYAFFLFSASRSLLHSPRAPFSCDMRNEQQSNGTSSTYESDRVVPVASSMIVTPSSILTFIHVSDCGVTDSCWSR